MLHTFSGKINEKFFELETVRGKNHKDETKPSVRPRLCKRGLFEPPKQIVQTRALAERPCELTLDININTLIENGFGDTLEEKGQEALDSYIDMRQAEAIQVYTNREEMMSRSNLQRTCFLLATSSNEVLLSVTRDCKRDVLTSWLSHLPRTPPSPWTVRTGAYADGANLLSHERHS